MPRSSHSFQKKLGGEQWSISSRASLTSPSSGRGGVKESSGPQCISSWVCFMRSGPLVLDRYILNHQDTGCVDHSPFCISFCHFQAGRLHKGYTVCFPRLQKGHREAQLRSSYVATWRRDTPQMMTYEIHETSWIWNEMHQQDSGSCFCFFFEWILLCYVWWGCRE